MVYGTERQNGCCEVARLAGVQFRYYALFFIFFLSQATQSPSSPHFPFPLPTPIQRRCRILDNVSLNTNSVTLSPRLHFFLTVTIMKSLAVLGLFVSLAFAQDSSVRWLTPTALLKH